MRKVVRIIPFVLLVIALAFNAGCSSLKGGVDISLEGLTLGAITMEGKPVTGLPSDKINLLLEVSAQKVTVAYSANGTILTLKPSGATIEIKANGVSIKGIKPDQVKVEWAVTK